MFSTSDTIVAIATPPGRGGIGVVRISGPGALAVARGLVGRDVTLAPRYATLCTLRGNADPQGSVSEHTAGSSGAIDRALVTYFPSPHSYTGDDVVEISAHGSPVVLQAIVSAAISGGTSDGRLGTPLSGVVERARMAEPGEFTLRAFVNGRIDLMQAEAVVDLVDAATPLQARAAFDQLNGTLTREIGALDEQLFDLIARLEASVDFPDEGYRFVTPEELVATLDGILDRTDRLLQSARRGRLIREGLQIAIVGRPNVGKSSLFNALAGAARAIVAENPGTTRDLVTETIDLEGLRVTLVDTAGLRETSDAVEAEGVVRAERAADVADLILRVHDGSTPFEPIPPRDLSRLDRSPQVEDNKTLTVINKCDLQRSWSREGAVEVSAATGWGMDALRQRIVAALDVDLGSESPGLTNVRHVALVRRAAEALRRARSAAESEGRSLSEEFVLADLQEARGAFEEVTGRRSNDDVLAHIFSRFCLGK